MFGVELTFGRPKRGSEDAQEDAITRLLSAFCRNENLVGEFLLSRGPGGWAVHGLAPAKDAFLKAHRNEWVWKRIAGLTGVDLKYPQIRFLGVAPETAPACECRRRRAFFLFTTFLSPEPPLRCLGCGGTVPTYRLPRPQHDEYSGLNSRKSNYQGCDTLQMGCTVGEQFGTRQMVRRE